MKLSELGFWEMLRRRWCKIRHPNSAMQPINGKYRCRECQLDFMVEWQR